MIDRDRLVTWGAVAAMAAALLGGRIFPEPTPAPELSRLVAAHQYVSQPWRHCHD